MNEGSLDILFSKVLYVVYFVKYNLITVTVVTNVILECMYILGVNFIFIKVND